MITPEQEKNILEQVVRPSVRIVANKAMGSGTIIYSKPNETNGKFDTYVLTNHHVIESNIKYEDKVWDDTLEKDVKKRFTSPVEVNLGRYTDLGFFLAAGQCQADIVTYTKEQDIALLKLKDTVTYPTALLYPHKEARDVPLFHTLVCCGAALGEFPPTVTEGRLNAFQKEIDNFEYWMSSAQSVFGNCLSGNTLISLANNQVKEIKNIQKGDSVWTATKNGLRKKYVKRLIESGEKDIYEIKTRTRTLRASDNHPVLCLEKTKDWYKSNQFGNENYLIPTWKQIKDLKEGDVIVVLSEVPEHNKSEGFNFFDVINQRKGERGKHELMEFLGFFLGDGYGRLRDGEGGEIQLYTYNQEKTQKYSKIIEFITGRIPTICSGGNQLRLSCTEFTKKLADLGFIGKIHGEKDIPDWVMTLKEEYQLSFINGYLEADGYVNKLGAWVFESASKNIIRKLRMMMIHLGINISNIHYRERESNFERYEQDNRQFESWSFNAYPTYKKSRNCYTSGKITGIELGNNLHIEKVRKIEPCGKEITYDIEVEDSHNFFADGVLVHNSGGAVYTAMEDKWCFLGIPSRIAVVPIGFGGSVITHVGYFIPVFRIYAWLVDVCYQFLYDSEFSLEKCEKLREEKKEKEFAMFLRKQG